MRPNYQGNKRRKEAARKKKQEEKRKKKLNKNSDPSLSEPSNPEIAGENPEPTPVQD